MIFARSPQGKGRVERAAGTFQDRLVTELRRANAGSILEANRVLKQFLPRFNQRFGVPPLHPEPAFRPLDPELCLEQTLCFKHKRRVAKDNTVRFQLHTLQLLPGAEHPSYAGAAVEVLEGLDGRLSVRHEGRIVPAQEAPPSPVFLRNGHGRSVNVPVPPSVAHGLGERWTTTLEPLDSRAEDERDQGGNTDSAAAAGKPKSTPTRKPTFLQRERWKAIQKARRKGMSLRAIERELGIHRATIKKYLGSGGLQRGDLGPVQRRQHLIPWQPNQVTFMLNSDTPAVHLPPPLTALLFSNKLALLSPITAALTPTVFPGELAKRFSTVIHCKWSPK